MSLAQKNIVVIGGTSGIGLAAAVQALRAKGHRVIVAVTESELRLEQLAHKRRSWSKPLSNSKPHSTNFGVTPMLSEPVSLC